MQPGGRATLVVETDLVEMSALLLEASGCWVHSRRDFANLGIDKLGINLVAIREAEARPVMVKVVRATERQWFDTVREEVIAMSDKQPKLEVPKSSPEPHAQQVELEAIELVEMARFWNWTQREEPTSKARASRPLGSRWPSCRRMGSWCRTP
jgi:hypothetical protein